MQNQELEQHLQNQELEQQASHTLGVAFPLQQVGERVLLRGQSPETRDQREELEQQQKQELEQHLQLAQSTFRELFTFWSYKLHFKYTKLRNVL